MTQHTSVKARKSAVALLNNGTDVNFIHTALIPPGWRNTAEEQVLPWLRTKPDRQTYFKVRIIVTLQLHLRDLRTGSYCYMAPQLSVNGYVGITFIEHFIRVTFLLEWLLASTHPSRIAIVPDPKPCCIRRSTQGRLGHPNKTVREVENDLNIHVLKKVMWK